MHPHILLNRDRFGREAGGTPMPLRLGPAGVPLSCKGRTIVEGMDDITALGLETMEIQTVRTVAPHHFDQYWQAGILSWKTGFEMNLHGPYYAEVLGNKRERSRTLSKMEASLQAAKIINARHITYHVGPYGEYKRGPDANEQVANVMAGVVDRCAQIWNNEDESEDYAAFPWVIENSPTLIGVETSGRQELWGSLEEVLEVTNHVEGTGPVLNLAHVHARGNGRLRTSEDFGELFDQVRESIGGKTFYCHFSGIEHRMGNALHYTQIKKSDLKFEPLAEFLAEDGDWLDITMISDSPLLEHDAMFMMQQCERARHRLFEKQARDDRRRKLAIAQGIDPDELAAREAEEKAKREAAEKAKSAPAPKAKKAEKPVEKPAEKAAGKKAKKSDDEGPMVIEGADDDDDLF